MSKTMKLGDTVRAEYHGVAIEGIVKSFDGSGYVHIRLNPAVEIYNTLRDSVCFSPHERSALKVVKEGPELADDQIGEMPYDCIGGIYLKGV